MRKTLLTILFCAFVAMSISAQTTAFTYQGSLKDGASPATGNYDFEFKLFDLASGGVQQGSSVQRLNVAVANGIFTVSLDFGAVVLPGADRFLEIGLRLGGNPGGFQQLLPRQQIGSSPYSIKSLVAENANSATTASFATNATQLGGVAADQYVVTTDPRMTNARPPTAGSSSYVQNTTSPQAAASFNITGTGTANNINAVTQYNLNGSRILSIPGTNNMFVGVGAGQNIASGTNNMFFGNNAGLANTVGNGNSFFGSEAGRQTAGGSFNSFFGYSAGRNNTGGGYNAFFGYDTGRNNTTGSDNSFFGPNAGFANTTGIRNSFFGTFAGSANVTGGSNSFFGWGSGSDNMTGVNNSFFGDSSGQKTTTGDLNSFFGAYTGFANTTANANSFFGTYAGTDNSTGINNTFIGQNTGSINTTGDNNTFLGKGAGTTNTTGSNNTLIGYNAEFGAANLTYATAVGADTVVTTSNTVVIGRDNDIVRVPGFIRVLQLGGAGATQLCQNGNFTISTCSSSLRYKTNINRFGLGLDLINRLKPITFDWKEGGMHDFGLGAEDVAAIEPLLVTYNDKGEVEGVKYDRIGVVLINAIKEQQKVIETQQRQIDAMKNFICLTNKDAEFCRE